MASVRFPTSLHALNQSLSLCVQSKSLEPLKLGQLSFETFFKTLYPFLMRYPDNQDKAEITALKFQMVQLFPMRENMAYYPVFVRIMNIFSGQTNQPVTFEVTKELSTLTVNLPSEHRLEDLLESQPPAANPKQKAARIQAALCCLLIEQRLLQVSHAEVNLLSPLLKDEQLEKPSNTEDPKIFGALVKYSANVTILRQALDGLFNGHEAFIQQYNGTKINIDNTSRYLPAGSIPYESSDALIQHEWIKHHSVRKMRAEDFEVLDAEMAVFNLIAPFGSWALSASRQMSANEFNSAYYDKRRAMNAKYFELRPQQAACYNLLYQELQSLYQRSRREFVGYLRDLATEKAALPKEFPSLSEDKIPDLKEFLRSIKTPAQPEVGFAYKPVIASYTTYIATQLELPAAIPEESNPFWQLASRAFTTAVDLFVAEGRRACFIHPTNRSREPFYLMPAAMTRSNGETKRGIIHVGTDKDNRCFYRLFVPMSDEQIIKRIAGTAFISDDFKELNEAKLHRGGDVEVSQPHSLPWVFDSFYTTLTDSRLGLTIQLFPIS